MYTPHVGKLRLCAKDPLRVARVIMIAAIAFIFVENSKFQGMTVKMSPVSVGERKLIFSRSFDRHLICPPSSNIDNPNRFTLSLFIALISGHKLLAWHKMSERECPMATWLLINELVTRAYWWKSSRPMHGNAQDASRDWHEMCCPFVRNGRDALETWTLEVTYVYFGSQRGTGHVKDRGFSDCTDVSHGSFNVKILAFR
jgi:hypothetical protein